jgi:hypothetical protein
MGALFDKMKVANDAAAASKAPKSLPPAALAAEPSTPKASTAELIAKVQALQAERDALESGQDSFSLGPALLKKLISGDKLNSTETRQIALLCKSIGYL